MAVIGAAEQNDLTIRTQSVSEGIKTHFEGIQMRNMKIAGMPVHDARSRVVIEINRQDISGGKSKDPSSCAAARACLRQVPKCTSVRVYKSRTYLKINNKWFRYHTPNSMKLEIVAFDRDANFLPGVYVLSPMQPSHRATGKSHSKSVVKKKVLPGPRKKRAAYHVIEGVREFTMD